MDGVILVVKPGTTKLSALQQALEQLRSVGARVLGVVLNEVNPTSRKYGYYYKRYHLKYSHRHQKPGGGQKRARKPDKLLQPETDNVFQSETDTILPHSKIKNR
jgi:Mrp family chromosome partitioning ATPase